MSEKIDKVKLAEAKAMYMNFKAVPDIAEATGINYRSLRYHIDNTWNKERSLEKEQFFEYLVSNKKHLLVNITDRALALIDNSLREMAAKPVIKLSDARIAVDILEKVDRILKLDEGKATTISTTSAPSTVFELRKRLNVDPFITLGNENEKSSTADSSNPVNDTKRNPDLETGKQ